MDPGRRDLARRLAEELASVEALSLRAADRIEELANVDARGHGWDELIAVRQLLHRLEADMAEVTVRCVTAEPMLVSYMETSWRRLGDDE